MIFITGDTHGRHDFDKLTYFATKHPNLTKNDYVIIAGDFGGLWSPQTVEEDLKPYEDLPFTVLFVDGNHENFELLSRYPVTQWNGGKVQFIKPSIIHLMRGQVYELEGKTFFTFGGGTSVDRGWRVEGVSWWPDEIPTEEELREARRNLTREGWRVDFIVTHSIDESVLVRYPIRTCSTAKLSTRVDNLMLNEFEERVDYGHWYFGHYHRDGKVNELKTALYQDVVQVV